MSEWLKFKTLRILNAKYVEQQDSHSLLVRMQDGILILKGSLAVSYKTNIVLTAIVLIGIYPTDLKTYIQGCLSGSID